MGWPDGVTTGQLRGEHVPAATVLANAIAAADGSGAYVTVDDFADELDGTASLALWIGDRIAGYGLVPPYDVVDGRSVVTIKGGIDPAFRRHGLGGPLLDWQLMLAAEDAEMIDVDIESTNSGGLALAAARGFRPVRYYHVMQRSYDDQPVRLLALPDGLVMIGFEPRYDERLRLAYNEVFTDHWGFVPKDEGHWTKWFTGRDVFRPAPSKVVIDGDRIAAFVLSYEFPVDTERTGVRELWIGQVGVRREYRGRGLGRAAMRAALLAGADAGFERSALGVDADNPTGATRLYESLGYITVSTKIRHRLVRMT